MNKIPNIGIIVGGGFSIKKGLSLGLHDTLANNFTCGCNYAYRYFDNLTFHTFVDKDFYTKNQPTLSKLPLIIGKSGGYVPMNNTIDLPTATRYTRNLSGGTYCYDEETEILTDKGWKLFKDLDKTEKVATLNIENDKVEYQIPTNYYKYNYKGKMIQEKSKRIDLLVTPNHKMLVKLSHHPKSPNYYFIEAQRLGNKEVAYRKDFPFKGKKTQYFTLPAIETKKSLWAVKESLKPIRKLRTPLNKELLYRLYVTEQKSSTEVAKILNTNYHTVLKQLIRYGFSDYIRSSGQRGSLPKQFKMEDWLKFLGWYLAEGCTVKVYKGNYKVIISSGNYLYDIKKTIVKLGYRYNVQKQNNCYNFTIQDKQLYTYLKQFGKAKDKFIPREFLNLSIRQSKILFHTLIRGDGDCSRKKGSTQTSLRYTTVSKQLMNDMYELGLKIGFCPNVLFENPHSSIIRNRTVIGQGAYRIHFARTKYTVINRERKFRNKINYNGQIYCVEVPNHVVYVRRKGKSCWCGNSPCLCGLFSLSLMIYLMDSGVIYLLGYDMGAYHTKNVEDTSLTMENKHIMSLDPQKRPLTHFYQGEVKQRGIGKVSYYNALNRPRDKFMPFIKDEENKKKIKIYNVSPTSRIPGNIIEKISYETFFEKLEAEHEADGNHMALDKEKLRAGIRKKLNS